MFQKDTLRLIKKTGKRFFSLVCIVFIGVAFMMGLLSTAVIMRTSVDRYDDQLSLHDIQLYSSYGFCEEDIEVIRKAEGLSAVYPSKTFDCFSRIGDGGASVTRVRELQSDTNQFELVSGRLPEKPDEALALSGRYRIGDVITLYLEDDDLSETLSCTEYTVTGTVKTSEYISKFLSTSNLGSRDLDTVVYIDNENFIGEYYTTVYTTVAGAKNLLSFSQEYEDLIADETQELELLAGDQQDYNKDKILAEALAEIEDGEKTLEEEREKGQAELDKAKRLLEESNIQLVASQMTIDTNKATLKAGEEKIKASEKLLAESKKQVDEAIKTVEKESGSSFDETYASMQAAYFAYTELNTVKDLVAGMDMQAIEDYLESLSPQSRIILDGILTEVASPEDVAQQLQMALDAIDESAGGSVADTYIQLTALKDGRDQVEKGYADLESGKAELESGKAQLEAAQKQVDAGRKAYEKGLKDYEEGILTFRDEIEKAENDIKKARQEVEDLPSAAWMILDRNSHYSSYMFKNTANQMNSIGVVMPLLFFLVAALVCLTTMTRLIDEQRGQIGIFMALGFSRAQIMGKYITYAFLASTIGAFFGIFAGMAMFPTVIYKTWRLMYNLPAMKMLFPPDKLAISFFAFAILMMGVTARVVNKSLKEVPAQLMRPKAPKNAKKIFLEKIKWLWNSLSFTSKITARNLIRYKGRFFMTVIGVAGCTSLLVLGFGIKDSIGDIVNVQFRDFFKYNYTVNLRNDHELDEIMADIEDDLNNTEMVSYKSYMTTVTADSKEATLTAIVVDPRQADDILGLFDENSGESLRLDNSGVIISKKFAKNNNIKVGDIISFNSSGGLHAQAEVTGICKMYFQHYLFISPKLYKNLFDEEIHANAIGVINTGDTAELKKLPEKYESAASVTNFDAFIDQFNTMIGALDIIIGVIIITAGSLALVVLINLTQVNISERVREIATLKVLGFNNKEVNGYIFKEILLLTLIGGVIGMPLGKVELKFVMSVIDMEMIVFPTDIKLPSYLISYAITLIFTGLVLLFTRKPLRKIEMVESLKSVE